MEKRTRRIVRRRDRTWVREVDCTWTDSTGTWPGRRSESAQTFQWRNTLNKYRKLRTHTSGGEKQTQFLGQTASPSSDESRQFPNFNPWNKLSKTKFREKKITMGSKKFLGICLYKIKCPKLSPNLINIEQTEKIVTGKPDAKKILNGVPT